MIWEQIARNRRRTALLLLGFAALAAAVAWSLWVLTDSLALAAVALVLAGVQMGVAWFAGDRAVLAYTGARPVDAKEHPQLHHLVEGLALAAQVPVPRAYIVHDDAPNAFATGRRERGAVAVTTGLLSKLSREELEGVVAHEVAHVANEDVRLMSTAFVLAGVLGLASDLALRMLRWRSLTGGRRRSRNQKGGSAEGLLLIVAVVILIVAPILARLITMAISRQREYLADAEAARLTRNPRALAGALRKIAADPDPVDHASLATAHLYISNPLRQGIWAGSLFSTHPPPAERIARLERM